MISIAILTGPFGHKTLFIGKDAEDMIASHKGDDENYNLEISEVHDIAGSLVVRLNQSEVITSNTRICNMPNCGV